MISKFDRSKIEVHRVNMSPVDNSMCRSLESCQRHVDPPFICRILCMYRNANVHGERRSFSFLGVLLLRAFQQFHTYFLLGLRPIVRYVLRSRCWDNILVLIVILRLLQRNTLARFRLQAAI